MSRASLFLPLNFFFSFFDMLDYFSKHIGKYLKYMLLAYALVSITYATARFYNITGPPHARTRRSVIEPILQEKETFFFAPLDQDSIEKDEQQELESIIYYDQLQYSQRDFGGNRGKFCHLKKKTIRYTWLTATLYRTTH